MELGHSAFVTKSQLAKPIPQAVSYSITPSVLTVTLHETLLLILGGHSLSYPPPIRTETNASSKPAALPLC